MTERSFSSRLSHLLDLKALLIELTFQCRIKAVKNSLSTRHSWFLGVDSKPQIFIPFLLASRTNRLPSIFVPPSSFPPLVNQYRFSAICAESAFRIFRLFKLSWVLTQSPFPLRRAERWCLLARFLSLCLFASCTHIHNTALGSPIELNSRVNR